MAFLEVTSFLDDVGQEDVGIGYHGHLNILVIFHYFLKLKESLLALIVLLVLVETDCLVKQYDWFLCSVQFFSHGH